MLPDSVTPACVSSPIVTPGDGQEVIQDTPAPVSVATHLQQSRAFNLARLRAGNSTPPNYQDAEGFAAKALELRELAHAADPEHTDSEWKNDTTPHAQMVSFLKKYPTIP